MERAAILLLVGAVAAVLGVVVGRSAAQSLYVSTPQAVRPAAITRVSVPATTGYAAGAQQTVMQVASQNEVDATPVSTVGAVSFAAAGAALGAMIAAFWSRRSQYEKLGSAAVVGAATSALAFGAPAYAGGADVFADNCSTCHVNGGNVISAGKVLSKTAIEEYLDGGYTKEAIEYQVRNGKGPMPAWEGVLSEDEIVAVTDYVYTQAGGAWANVS